jgi:hypothetical protein
MHNIDIWDLFRVTMPVWSPVASGLIAAFIVHLLTQSRERERWLLDSKKQEFKELLSALSESYVTVLSLLGPLIPGPLGLNGLNHSEEKRYKGSVDNLARVVRSRLFIVEDLQLENMLGLWSLSIERYFKLRDESAFNSEYKLLSDLTINAAARSLPKTAIQRLKFWRN